MIDLLSGPTYQVFRHTHPYMGVRAHFDDFSDLTRDGVITFDGVQWCSENKRYVSVPFGVMDDFGNVVATQRPASHSRSIES